MTLAAPFRPRRMLVVGFVLLGLVLDANATSIAAQDWQRGIKNYQAIIAHQKAFDQLSPEEQSEVIMVIRMMESRSEGEGKSPDCQNALTAAESTASDLELWARRLLNCAAGHDFADDCGTEMRRVRNSYFDYEAAVSSVQSYCD